MNVVISCQMWAQPRQLRQRASLCLGLLAVAACGGRDRVDDANVTRSDSSGVRIITSTGPDRDLAWRLVQADVLRDSLAKAWLFTTVTPRHVLTDRAGRSYVLDGEAIRRFGRDGRYERSIGRAGDNPGETQGATALLQQGDSIAVLDLGRRVIVRWDPEFAPLNDIPLRGALDGLKQVAFRSGGLWVQRERSEGGRNRTELFGDTLAESPLLAITSDESQRRTMRVCGNRVAFRQPTFFSPVLRWTNAGPRILANIGPSYELQLYEGPRLLAHVRREIPMRIPETEDLERLYPEGLRLDAPGMDCTIPFDVLREGAQFASLIPAVQGLSMLSDGTMWVQRTFAPERPVVLDVFGSDGAYVGTLRGYHLPVGLLPNGEYLFPRDDDEFGGLVIARVRIAK